MKYEIVNEKLNIKACTIGDLTFEQVRSFLEARNDGSSISTYAQRNVGLSVYE